MGDIRRLDFGPNMCDINLTLWSILSAIRRSESAVCVIVGTSSEQRDHLCFVRRVADSTRSSTRSEIQPRRLYMSWKTTKKDYKISLDRARKLPNLEGVGIT